MPGDKKFRFRKLAPVVPRLNWSRQYEQQIRKTVVTPFFNNVTKTFGDSLLHLDKQILSQADLSQLRVALARTNVNITTVNHEVDKVLTQLSHRHTMDVNRVFKRGIGVDIRPLLSSDAIRPYMQEKIAENVKLIVTMSEKHKTVLLEKLHKDLVNKPFDRESITKFLRQGNKSSGYNLRRIVRDQTNKVTGQHNSPKGNLVEGNQITKQSKSQSETPGVVSRFQRRRFVGPVSRCIEYMDREKG